MRRFNPIEVVLHCGLHKTGSTYIQRNLQCNKQILLNNGILYIGPKTLIKSCPQIWRHTNKQKPIKSTKQKHKLKQEIQKIVAQLPQAENEEIHTILISSEAIFGKLRDGFQHRKSGHKDGTGIYRHAKKRSNLLLSAIKNSLNTKPSKYTIFYMNRNQHSFEKSCYAQLIKEGQKHIGQLDFDTFRLTSDFSRANDAFLKKSLSSLQSKYNLKIISMNYDTAVNHEKPSDLLWSFLEKALPKQSQKIKHQITSDPSNSNLDKIHNPGLNEKGLFLARLSLQIHNRHERKRFRKYLEKHFNKSSCQKNTKPFENLRLIGHYFTKGNAFNERGNAIESLIQPHLNAEERLTLKSFLSKHYPKTI